MLVISLVFTQKTNIPQSINSSGGRGICAKNMPTWQHQATIKYPNHEA